MSPVLLVLCPFAVMCCASAAGVVATSMGTMRREPHAVGSAALAVHGTTVPRQDHAVALAEIEPQSEMEEGAGSNFGFHDHTFRDLLKVRQGAGLEQESRDSRLAYALQVDAEQARRAEEEDRERRKRADDHERAKKEDARRRLAEQEFKWTQEEQAEAEEEDRTPQDHGLRATPFQGWTQPKPQGKPNPDDTKRI